MSPNGPNEVASGAFRGDGIVLRLLEHRDDDTEENQAAAGIKDEDENP